VWFFLYVNDRFSNEMISTTQYPKLEWLSFCHYITLAIELFCETITPNFLKQHFALCAKLAELGITEKYSRSSVRQWKRHVVQTHSSFYSRMIARIIAHSEMMSPVLDEYGSRFAVCKKATYIIYLLLLEKVFGDTYSLKLYKYAYWKSHSLEEITGDEIPHEVMRVMEKVGSKRTHPVVEKAYLGIESLDPFLTYSVLPCWLNKVLCFFGITYFNLTVMQWGDPAFTGSKFDKKVPIR